MASFLPICCLQILIITPDQPCRLLAHGGSTTLAGVGLVVLGLLGLAALEGSAVTLVLEALGSDQALDLGSLGVGGLALALGLDLTADDVLADIVILGEAEEPADLGRTLGAEALGVHDVGEAGNVLVALLDDGQGQDGHVHADDAAVDGLALALTGAAGAVARVALGERSLTRPGTMTP